MSIIELCLTAGVKTLKRVAMPCSPVALTAFAGLAPQGVMLLILVFSLCKVVEANEQSFNVMNAFAEANGGEFYLRNLSAVEMKGTLTREDKSWNFQVWKRRPELSRMVLSQRDGPCIWVNDGAKILVKEPLTSEYIQPSVDDERIFRVLSSLIHPAWHRFEKSESLIYEGTETLNGEICDILSFDSKAYGVLYSLIERNRKVLVKVYFFKSRQSRGSVNKPELEMFFADHRQIGKMAIPFSVHVTRGIITDHYKIESVTTNPGLIPFIFGVDGKGVKTPAKGK